MEIGSASCIGIVELLEVAVSLYKIVIENGPQVFDHAHYAPTYTVSTPGYCYPGQS